MVGGATAGVVATAALVSAAVLRGHVSWQTVAAVVGGVTVTTGAVLTVMVSLLKRMHANVGVAPPTAHQLEEENAELHPLFRHVPALVGKLAWRRLGTFPTPVHVGECEAPSEGKPGTRIKFLVKREDLSSPQYGGNKVRTLEHQLAVLESKNAQRVADNLPPRNVVVLGSGGSNQVVATVVHGMYRFGLNVIPAWVADPPDLDNTLNMLSTLSFPIKDYMTWGTPLKLMSTLFGTAFCPSETSPFLMAAGGNTETGVLGQLSGALELAEQIQAGEVPDIDGLYLAVGSSCTVSGLIMGVALARKLGLSAFKSPDFKVHVCPIHHAFAALSHAVGLYRASWSKGIPLTIQHSIHTTNKVLVELGGPDILDESLEILQKHTVMHDQADVVGEYGEHSDISRKCAHLFDDTVSLSSGNADNETVTTGMWLCGHFCAKAFYSMATDLVKPENKDKTLLFWQTKSAVQPRGPEDEWAHIQAMPTVVKKWANDGEAHSKLRPGSVNIENGDAGDYRVLMTSIKTA